MAPLHLEIDARPAYELLMTLAVMSDAAARSTYEVGAQWFAEIRREASPELLRNVEAFSGGSDLVWAHLVSLAYESPLPRDVPAFLDYLDSTDPAEIRLRLLGYYVRFIRRATPPEVIAAAAAGDATAQREFRRTSMPADAAWEAALRHLLALDPESTKSDLLSILQRWHTEVFGPREAGLMPILRHDAEAKEALARTEPVERVLEAGLEGFEYIPEPGFDRVLLIPSYITRPHIHNFDHHDLKIFVYPVADESLSADPDSPSPRLVRLLKALGDERRLRILKRLTAGSYTLQELADYFEAGNTTMLHHLIILRAAGLVRVRSAPPKTYSVRREVLPDVAHLLGAYLEDETPSPLTERKE